jgi:hypothetical protein
MKDNDKTNWAYLAGLLDGEGCFTITGTWKNRKGIWRTKTGPNTYFHINLIISLYNTDLKVMKWLVDHFGGVYYVHHPSKKPSHKIGYSWHPKGAKNKELLLLGILPYLVIKREQAKLSLEYIRLDGKACQEKRLELREKIQTLNGHGMGKRLTTNMSDGPSGLKIESGLSGDTKSALEVTQAVARTTELLPQVSESVA